LIAVSSRKPPPELEQKMPPTKPVGGKSKGSVKLF